MRAWRAMLGCLTLAALAPRPARAMDAPFTWMQAACYADAVVDVDVTLSAPGSKPKVEVLNVLWTRYPDKRVRPQINYGLPDRRELNLQLRARGRPEGTGYPPHVFDLFATAVASGHYRETHFVSYGRGGWTGVQGVVEFSYVHWLDHPSHARFWTYVEPLLRARSEAEVKHGRGAKPDFCRQIDDEDFSDRQAEIERQAIDGRKF